RRERLLSRLSCSRQDRRLPRSISAALVSGAARTRPPPASEHRPVETELLRLAQHLADLTERFLEIRRPARGLVDPRAAPALLLRLVQRQVCRLEQVAWRVHARLVRRDARAHREPLRRRGRQRQRRLEPPYEDHRAIRPTRAEQGEKAVVADPRGEVHTPGVLLEDTAELRQRALVGGLAVPLPELLVLIRLDQH